MLFRSMLSSFAGVVGMIFRFLLIILFCISFLWCAFSAVSLPFLREGVWYLAGAVISILFVALLLLLGREKDDSPAEQDFQR